MAYCKVALLPDAAKGLATQLLRLPQLLSGQVAAVSCYGEAASPGGLVTEDVKEDKVWARTCTCPQGRHREERAIGRGPVA